MMPRMAVDIYLRLRRDQSSRSGVDAHGGGRAGRRRRRVPIRVGIMIVLLAQIRGEPCPDGIHPGEHRVAGGDSVLVVRASIVDVSPGRPDREREELVWKTITVDVHETLKGSHAKLLDFAFLSHAGGDV